MRQKTVDTRAYVSALIGIESRPNIEPDWSRRG